MQNEDKKFILELIAVYRSLPALWNLSSKDYKKKEIKNEQYEILLKKYQERYPSAVKKDLTRKLNSIRTNYRREVRRQALLERQGVSNSPCNLFYFDALRFLRSNDAHFKSDGNDDLESTNFSETHFGKYSPDHTENELQDNEATVELEKNNSESENYDSPEPPIKQFKPNWENDVKIAEAWAIKLNRMQPMQRILAEGFIEGILFEGQLGTLHRNAMTLHIGLPVNNRQLHRVESDPFGVLSPKYN